MKNPSARNFWSVKSLIFYFFIIILAVIAATHFTELEDILAILRNIRPVYLILALVLQTLTYWANARVYYDLMAAFKVKSLIKVGELFKCSISSLTINQIMPSAGVSGNTFILSYFYRQGIKWRDALKIVIFELTTYYGAALAIFLLLLFYFTFSFTEKISGVFYTFIFLGIIIFALAIAAILFIGTRRQLPVFLNKVVGWKPLVLLERRFQTMLAELRLTEEENTGIISWQFLKRSKRRVLAGPLGWQLLLILFDSLTIYLLFAGFNVEISLVYVVLGLMATRVVALFSFIPGALIFFEGSMIFFYSLLGVPAGMALIVTLLFRFLSFWLPMPAGLFYYKRLSAASPDMVDK